MVDWAVDLMRTKMLSQACLPLRVAWQTHATWIAPLCFKFSSLVPHRAETRDKVPPKLHCTYVPCYSTYVVPYHHLGMTNMNYPAQRSVAMKTLSIRLGTSAHDCPCV